MEKKYKENICSVFIYFPNYQALKTTLSCDDNRIY